MIAPDLEDLPTMTDPLAGLALTLQDWLQNGPETAPSDKSSDGEDIRFAHSRNAQCHEGKHVANLYITCHAMLR